jgi:5-methylcytosine-specific restriction endonuclease McrA
VYQGDNITKDALLEMFEYICQICKGTIDPWVKHPSNDSATIEHVVPLSKGGLHVWSNVVPAHRGCNRSKGDLLPEEYELKLAQRHS